MDNRSGVMDSLTGPGQEAGHENGELTDVEGQLVSASGEVQATGDTVTENGKQDSSVDAVDEKSETEETRESLDTAPSKEDFEADVDDNYNEVNEEVNEVEVKPNNDLKQHKQVFHAVEEQTLNRLDSIDIENNVHADLGALHDTPTENTLEDQLKELTLDKRQEADLSLVEIDFDESENCESLDIIKEGVLLDTSSLQYLKVSNDSQSRESDVDLGIAVVQEAFVSFNYSNVFAEREISSTDDDILGSNVDGFDINSLSKNGDNKTAFGLSENANEITSVSSTNGNTSNEGSQDKINSDIKELSDKSLCKSDTNKRGDFGEQSTVVAEPLVEVTVSDTDTMPETRVETRVETHGSGCVSPSLMYASCRYRWERTISTQTPSVVFVTLNNKVVEPIKLNWQESNQCFYSEEYRIPVGTYVGNLIVDGNFYPVEDVTIKHYTFEVDLYLREDIIDDEATKTGINKAEAFLKQKSDSRDYGSPLANSQPNTDTSYYMDEEKTTLNNQETESSIHKSSKYKELLRAQMSQSLSALEKMESEPEIYSSLKSEMDDDLDGRRSPVGEDGLKQYQDDEGDTSLRAGDLDVSTGADLMELKDTVNASVIEDDVEHWSTQSNMSQTQTRKQLTSDLIDDVLGNGHNRSPIYSTESPVHSKHSSVNNSARQTPNLQDTQERSRPNSVTSANSANSVSRHVLDDILQSAVSGPATSPLLGESPSASRGRSPARSPAGEQISDVLNPSDRHSPIRREYLMESLHTAQNGTSAHNSANNSQRQTPTYGLISDSLRSSHEKLYSAQDIRRASSHESQNSAGSRPQSLTSEQELTQYYETLGEAGKNASRSGSADATPLGQRSGSASSLPIIGSQRNSANLDKRSMTPDNHIRVPATGPIGPIIKGPLLPHRSPARTPVSTSSSRTVTPSNTPVNGAMILEMTEQEHKYREKVKDLENTVSNLRLLLTSREQEVTEVKGQLDDLRDKNKKLQGDLDYQRSRASPGPQLLEMERKYKTVLEERDALRTEVGRLIEENRQQKEPGLNSYNPNGPSALQRKIDDLTGQVQDLHEVNEATAEELRASERRVKELAGENETLRVTRAARHTDTEEEVRRLQAEVKRLKEIPSTYSEATDYRVKIELQQVKEDNRNLRERNYTLHDDNIRLKEELSNLRKSLDLVDNTRKSLRDERKSRQSSERYTSRKNETTETSYHGNHESLDYRLSVSAGDRPGDAKFGSLTQGLYDKKADLDKSHDRKSTTLYDTDRFTKSETTRYDLYRSNPDGGPLDRHDTPLHVPATPEKPSALTMSRKDMFYSTDVKQDRYGDREDRLQYDRSRTESGDVEFRSSGRLKAYDQDLSQTAPALTGRSRGAARRSDTDGETVVFSRSNPPYLQRQGADKDAKGYDPPRSSTQYHDDGEMSDTATDILVSATPMENLRMASSWGPGRPRRGSMGSDASHDSFSDIDEQITASVRRRSKSADNREILKRFGATGGLVPAASLGRLGSATNLQGEKTQAHIASPAPPPSGLRTVTVRPLITQHNKGMSHSVSQSLTFGLRPFAPRSAGDLNIEDVIKFSRQGGKLSQGTIKFIGHLPGRGDIYLGVELDKEDGKHDGTFEDIRYFKCKPNKGVFVAYNKVVMAWTNYN